MKADYLSSASFSWLTANIQDFPISALLHDIDALLDNTLSYAQSGTAMDARMARCVVKKATVVADDWENRCKQGFMRKKILLWR